MRTDRRRAAGLRAVAVGLLLAAGLLGVPGAAAGAGAGDRAVGGAAAHEASAGAAPAPAADDPAASPATGLVLVGTGDLHWTDVDRTATPTLWQLVAGGSVGSLSVGNATAGTCPVDAWLTMSAGHRSTAPGPQDAVADTADPGQDPAAQAHDLGLDCPALPAAEPTGAVDATTGTGAVQVAGWAALTAAGGAATADAQQGASSDDQAGMDAADAPALTTGVPGALGERLAAVGVCATAVGPGAAVALARADGSVARYAETLGALPAGGVTACPVTVVDAGELGYEPTERRAALSLLDRELGRLMADLPAGWHLVVAGLTGSASDQGLPAVLDWRAGGGDRGWLTSESTRRPGLVTVPDLTASLAAVAGADATGLDGAVVEAGEDRRLSTERTVENRRYLTELTSTVTHLLPVFAGVLLVAGLIAGAGLVRRRSVGPAGRRAVVAVLLVGSSAPAGAYLAALSRWWVQPAPVVAASLWTAAATAAVALVAWWVARLLPYGPWRLGTAVAGVTWLVLTVDGLTGTLLQQGSVLGASASVGARYYGFGNLTFSVYAASALVLAGGLAARTGGGRAAVAVVSAVGLVTVAVDGWPGFGADVGGILALVPAFVVLALGMLGRGATLRRVLAGLGLAVLVTAVVGVVDWMGPGPASHLGRFVEQVVQGRAWSVLADKAAGAWATVANPVGAAAALVVLALAFALVGPRRPAPVDRAYRTWPLLRRVVVAVLVVAGLGTLLNDSGVAVAVVVLATTGGMLATSWAEHRWCGARAPADPGDAPVRAVPVALALVGGGLAAALLLGSAVAPAQVAAGDVTRGPVAAAVPPDAPLVVIGTQGVRWPDVDRTVTPTLWALVRDGAQVGAVAPGVSSADRRCVSAGWLALSAGQTVLTRDEAGETCLPWSVVPGGGAAAGNGAGAGAGAGTGAGTGDGSATVDGWADLVAAQRRSAFDPHPGELGDALAGTRCATAVGAGAALALAGTDGGVPRYRDLAAALADPADAFDCPVTVVDAGAVPYTSAPRLSSSIPLDPLAPTVTNDGVVRDQALTRLDRTVRELLAAVPDDATVLLVDVGNPSTGRSWLGVGAVTQAETAGRYLTTASTRWQGVVRLLDVPSSVLAAAGLPEPADFTGSPLLAAGVRPVDVSSVVDGLADLSSRDQALRGLSGWLTGTPLLVALALLSLVWALARMPRPARQGGTVVAARRGVGTVVAARRGVDGALLVLGALPVGMYLMTTWSWWRAASPVTAMWLTLAAATLTVAGVAALAPRRPVWAGPAVVAGVTFGVLTLDALLGTPLHRGSPLGPSPTLGGRYYGFGNPTYSVYVVAALVSAAALGWWLRERGHRWLAVLASGAIGVVALLVDVLPGLGADVGGGLVLLPAAAMVALAAGGVRVTWTRVGLIGAVGVVLVAGIGVLDWLRPADQRTHLGRFVQQVIDGTAWATIVRKAGYAAATLTSGPTAWITLLVVVALVLLVLPHARRRVAWFEQADRAWPMTRPLVVGLLVAAVAGSLVNDYGTRIATVLLAAAVPLLGQVVLRAAEREPAEPDPAEPDPAEPDPAEPDPAERDPAEPERPSH